MSQIRARLAALRARREHRATAPPAPQENNVQSPHSRPHHPHPAAHHHLEWRTRARRAASDRVRRAVLESGVYDVITRPLPEEKDDLADLEKQNLKLAMSDAEGPEEPNDGDDPVEQQDEEEAALERLQLGIVSDLDTRHEDTPDQPPIRQLDHPEPTPDREEPDSVPTNVIKKSEHDTTEQPTHERQHPHNSQTKAQEEHHPAQPDKQQPPLSETTPEAPAPSPTQHHPTPPPNPFGMVDDEAEDDEDRDSHHNSAPLLSTDEAEDIVPDADIAQDEAASLAHFHRKWEAEQMQPANPTYDDLDDAMDFTDVKAAGDEAVSAEGGEQTPDCAENYIDAMFLRDDSKSKVVDVEQEDDAGNETTREKARALWKARQKFRTHLRERDESNSLSRFDLFNDSQNRSADIRSRLEKSCRPAPLRDVTNVVREKKRKLEPPEWARRKEVLAQKERKRRRAVSVGNWSFTMHGKREEVDMKKTSARPSLGAAHLSRRSRTRKAATPPRRKPPVAVMKKRRTGATSFKGLLSVLGKQASVEPRR